MTFPFIRSIASGFLAMGASALIHVGCGQEAPRSPDAVLAVTDDAGREVRLSRPARRIVSLVPSVTETIVALGGADRLVARTDYDRAPGLARLPSLGGGLDPSVETLVELRPDLVVAWDARDAAGLRARLEAAGIPVYSAAIQDTEAVFATIRRMSSLLGLRPAGRSLGQSLRDTLEAIAAESDGRPPARVLFLLDGNPPRTAGPGTFVAELLLIAGAEPAYPALTGEWPAVALETLVANPPDVILVPIGSEGLPALASRAGWRAMPAVRDGRVVGLPADLVSRPGPSIGQAARAIRDSLRAVTDRTEAF